jgi:hypothetical protein
MTGALKSIVEPGSMVTEASYIIFTDGTNVYARDGNTGEIVKSSTNASEVIQYAIDNLPNMGGIPMGKIFVKTGTYKCDTPINFENKAVIFWGEGKYATNFMFASGINGINFGNQSQVDLSDFTLTLNSTNSGHGIFGRIGASRIGHIRIVDWDENHWGMWIYDSTLYVDHIYLLGYGDGVLIEEGAYNGYFAGKAGNSLINRLEINLQATGLKTDRVYLELRADTPDEWVNLYEFNYVFALSGHTVNDRLRNYANIFLNGTSGPIKHNQFNYVNLESAQNTFVLKNADDNTFLGGFTWNMNNGINIASNCYHNVFENLHIGGLNSPGQAITDNAAWKAKPNSFMNIFITGNWTNSVPITVTSATKLYGISTYTNNTYTRYSENSGAKSNCINGTWIAHDLISTPSSVQITPTNKRITAVFPNANSTHFQVGLWDENGNAITTPEYISWYAEV